MPLADLSLDQHENTPSNEDLRKRCNTILGQLCASYCEAEPLGAGEKQARRGEGLTCEAHGTPRPHSAGLILLGCRLWSPRVDLGGRAGQTRLDIWVLPSRLLTFHQKHLSSVAVDVFLRKSLDPRF